MTLTTALRVVRTRVDQPVSTEQRAEPHDRKPMWTEKVTAIATLVYALATATAVGVTIYGLWPVDDDEPPPEVQFQMPAERSGGGNALCYAAAPRAKSHKVPRVVKWIRDIRR